MSSSAAQPESSLDLPPNLTSEDYFELQNPREETPYTEYYKELDPEEPISLFTFTNGEIYRSIDENTTGLEKYTERQSRVDKVRKSRVKIPSFRKISNSEWNIPNSISTPHFNSALVLEKLGFNNLNYDKTKELELPLVYFRPDLNKDALIRGKLPYYSKTFQTHYDMDETDLLFLNWINKISKEIISMEQFEIIISFFEIKIHQIERLLPPTIKDRSTIDQQQQQNAFLYGSDDGTGFEHQDEQACAICDSSECDNTNSIIFCDGCDIAVHQDCYGVSFIPEGPWLCRRCLIARNSVEKCIFCPSITGAFKQTDGGDWAHVLCALWTPVLYFANPIYMEPIEGIENIPKSRWKLICYICKQKEGVCIQCSKPSCFAAYHVTCAKRAGIYMKMKKDIKTAINDNSCLVSFCDKHTPIEWGMQHDVKKGIDKTRLYFHDRNNHTIDEINDADMTMVTESELKELQYQQSEKFKWRLNQNNYVIPSIIIDELIKFHTDHKLPDITKVTLNQIAKYYTLKRQHMGKPLIKRPDIFSHASLPEHELESRIETVKYFSEDVNKLKDISKLIVKKSKLTKTLIEDKLDTANMIYRPKKWVMTNLISFFQLRSNSKSEISFPKYAVKPTIFQIIENCNLGKYPDLEQLINDIEKFSDWICALNLNINSPMSETQKLFRSWSRYKKQRYQAAREYINIIDNQWNKIKDEFIMHDSLEIEINKPEEYNHTNEDIDNSNIEQKDNIVGGKKYRRKRPKTILGIDVSEFLLQEESSNGVNNIPGRHLRKRKVDEESTDAGGALKARLDKVKLRSNVQNLRKKRVTRKK
ncbi:nuA3 HAT complex component nto1 [Pichia californica]|uniref:NuA3 HAT complex component nto1 n=1 Tax=Pichia californica TaxID=460514 RepID=A0A9P6WR50_9ASCO|nr:nuA3 HAT complex component nto1 [[Candida] californica]KAG0690578.1 nuA3 HAT complex component nto1 [[Candida] californica]